ncbi:hypothetical protein LPJ53_002906 [Coemansia erecta]|uniref:Uncharacterized protein n=1 Tax=Coemansia erecta TaxID=147472 RepID=A0A9W7Y2A9_9FUNG|nr:hypothetical protein LPJ53_002906 [Coemansia erecta]
MEIAGNDLTRILSALQGMSTAPELARPQQSPQLPQQQGPQPAPAQRRQSVWAVPASVGSDLARGTTLSNIAAMWDNLDEVQKLNVVFGMVHVGVGKVHDKQAAETISKLALNDATSDWVRIVGGLLGPVGSTGDMRSPDELAKTTRDEIEHAIAQIAEAVKGGAPGLLTTPALTYMEHPNASAALCNMYGVKPKAEKLSQIAEAAAAGKDKETDFVDLFGDEDDTGNVDEAGPALVLHTKESHAVNHVARMSLLQAAMNTRKPSIVPGVPGGRAGPGVTRLSIPTKRAGPVSGKVEFLTQRRRAAPTNTALPPPTLPQPRLSASSEPKKIQMLDLSASMLNGRERLLEENKAKKAREREERAQRQKAEAAERKRKREEARENKQAANESKRARARKTQASEDEYGESGEASSSEGEALSAQLTRPQEEPEEPIVLDEPEEPREYMVFNGGENPQVQAVYNHTNALSDIDRLRMYCFFTNQAPPEGTLPKLEVVLNERIVDDPSRPGGSIKEMMIFHADFNEGVWRKVRRNRKM